MQGETVQHLGQEEAIKHLKDGIREMNKLSVDILLPDDTAEACIKSVSVEAREKDMTRTDVSLKKTGDGIKLSISSEDLHGLRAGLNTYLRWIILCIQLTCEENQDGDTKATTG